LEVEGVIGTGVAFRMLKIRLSQTAFFGIGIVVGFVYLSAVSQSSPQPQPQPPPPAREIHVDRSCKVLLDKSDALSDYAEDDLRNDHAICHLESVFTSHHIEEKLRDGMRLQNNVTIQEQEYLLQNVTSTPVTFVVEHVLPDDWKIDSDPKPVKVVDNTAFFRVNAEPGQIVRLHVGERHAIPIADGD
jgi:hypothetical protein